jgi:hypothetical protein
MYVRMSCIKKGINMLCVTFFIVILVTAVP